MERSKTRFTCAITLLVCLISVHAIAQPSSDTEREALEARSEQAFQMLDDQLEPEEGEEGEEGEEDHMDLLEERAVPEGEYDPGPQEPEQFEQADSEEADPSSAANVNKPKAAPPTQQELYERLLAEEEAADVRRQRRRQRATNWVQEQDGEGHIHYLDETPTTVVIKTEQVEPRTRRLQRQRYRNWHFVGSHRRAHGPRTHVHKHDRQQRRAHRNHKRKKRLSKTRRKANRKRSARAHHPRQH
jgi:hypothetical protein